MNETADLSDLQPNRYGTRPLDMSGYEQRREEFLHQHFARIEADLIILKNDFLTVKNELRKTLVGGGKLKENTQKANDFFTEIVELKSKYEDALGELAQENPTSSLDKLLLPYQEAERLQPQIAELAREIYRAFPLANFSGKQADMCTAVMMFCNDLPIFASPQNGEREYLTEGYYIKARKNKLTPPTWFSLQERTTEHPELLLSPNELATLQEAQDQTYKIHLEVPNGQYRDVILALVEYISDPNHADVFNKWKFLPLESNTADHREVRSHFPTVVFYPTGETADHIQNNLKDLVDGITDALQSKGIQLPANVPLPRFSRNISRNGQNLSGLSYVRGDGDHKEYLKKHGLLDEYYDASKNYAERVGQQTTF